MWTDIISASEASVMLGKNPKYIYFLWRRGSSKLLEGSVIMKGNTLLITRAGFDHLNNLTKKESDLAIKSPNSKVLTEVLQSLRNSPRYIILNETG